MEVEQVTLELEGEAGRSLGEVNTTSIKTVLTQDEPQTVDFRYKKSILASDSEIVSARNSEARFLLFVGPGTCSALGKHVQFIIFFSRLSLFHA